MDLQNFIEAAGFLAIDVYLLKNTNISASSLLLWLIPNCSGDNCKRKLSWQQSIFFRYRALKVSTCHGYPSLPASHPENNGDRLADAGSCGATPWATNGV